MRSTRHERESREIEDDGGYLGESWAEARMFTWRGAAACLVAGRESFLVKRET
jgi:hypothetical protein